MTKYSATTPTPAVLSNGHSTVFYAEPKNPQHWTGDVQDIAPDALWGVNCFGCGYVGPLMDSRAGAGEAWNDNEGLQD